MTTQRMDVSEPREPANRCCAKCGVKFWLIIIGLLLIVASAVVVRYAINNSKESPQTIDDPESPPSPSFSKQHYFKEAAVCVDSPQCAEVGRDILKKGGNAIDAAIAAMFCNGLLNHQSTGLGGGFIMTIYLRKDRKAYSLIAREKAPAKTKLDMFGGDADKAKRSPLSIGVPGEVRGLYQAHVSWGRLSWQELVTPTVNICRNGFTISKVLYDSFAEAPYIKDDEHLRKMYFDESKNEFLKENDTAKPSEALCNTLNTIATEGGNVMYSGTLAKDLAEDLKELGSIITYEDLKDYDAVITEPLSFDLGNETIYTAPPPGSGAILIEILNILKEYNFNTSSISTEEAKILTYHRIIEAFKFSYATRTKLGDKTFVPSVNEIIKEVIDPQYGKKIKAKINDEGTSNDTLYYNATRPGSNDSGTAHVSVVDEEGNAVSVTSSVNYYFGIGVTTNRTGIVLNNVMDDFSYPGIINYFGVEPSPENYAAPKKRPLSSMSPTVVVGKDGDVRLVIGASGGTKITSAIALAMMRIMWLGQTVKQAVDEPRIHHQIYPMLAYYEQGVTKNIVAGLRAKGHGLKRYGGRGSIVCGIFKNASGVYGNADYRKGGDVSGM